MRWMRGVLALGLVVWSAFLVLIIFTRTTQRRDVVSAYLRKIASNGLLLATFDNRTVDTGSAISHGDSRLVRQNGIPSYYILEEIRYEPFKMELPFFVDKIDGVVFKKGRCAKDFLPTYNTSDKLIGKPTVVFNGYFTIPYDCGYKSKLENIMKVHSKVSKHYKNLAIAIVPDGWSFQHFLDGTLPKIVQMYKILRKNNVPLLLDRVPRDKVILEMLDKLGWPSENIVYMTGKVSVVADRLYYTCWTPPLHPSLWQQSQLLFGVYGNATTLAEKRKMDAPVEISGRRAVVFLNRNSKNSFNGGRMIVNQKELVEYLQKRYGDDFVNYDSKKYPGLKNAVKIFSSARIVVGIHGGGMYNIQFARAGTHVVEMLPVTATATYVLPRCMVYIIANLLNQPYWHVTMRTLNSGGNIRADIKKLARVFDKIDGMEKHSKL